MNQMFASAPFRGGAFLLVGFVLVLALSTGTSAQTVTTMQVKLVPQFAYQEDDGTSNITGLITITDNGSTLSVTGTATGMITGKTYVSLFYDKGSKPTHVITPPPGNVNLRNACLPTEGFQPPQTFSQMVIGIWTPPTNGGTTWTLTATKSGAFDAPVPLAYLPVNQAGTVSVREDTQAGQPIPNQPNPNRFRLRACGPVTTIP